MLIIRIFSTMHGGYRVYYYFYTGAAPWSHPALWTEDTRAARTLKGRKSHEDHIIIIIIIIMMMVYCFHYYCSTAATAA